MKYILAENKKFILNERFNLEERFVLTEADDDTILANNFASVKPLADELLEALQASYSEDIIDNYIRLVGGTKNSEKGNELINLFNSQKKEFDKIATHQVDDYQTIINPIKNYINEFERRTKKEHLDQTEELASTLDTLKELTSDTAVKEYAGKSDGDKKDTINNLLGTFNDFHLALTSALSGSKTNNTTNNAVLEKLETLNDVLNTNELALTKLLANLKNSEEIDFAALGKAIEEYQTTITENAVSENDFKDAPTTQPQERLDNLINGARKVAGLINTEAGKESEEADIGKEEKDWAKLLDIASKDGNPKEALSAFWTDYYTTEWKNNAKAVSDLGDPFRKTLMELGFTEATNGFVTFVKNNINRLNHDNFIGFYNAFVSRYIDRNDLKGKDNKLLKFVANLLSNKNIYSLTSRQIYDYLRYQKEVLSQYGKLPAKFETPNVAAQYGAAANANLLIFDNQYQNIEENQPIRNDLTNSTLTPLSGVRARFETYIDKLDEKVEVKGSTIFDLLNRNQKEVMKVMVFLALKNGTDTKPADELLKKYDIPEEEQTITPKAAAKYQKLLNRFKIEPSNITAKLKELADAAEIKVKE